MLATHAVLDALISQLTEQISALVALATTHRGTRMVARTLTQHAVPTTFGAKVASWLNGVVDAYEQLSALEHPGSGRRCGRNSGRDNRIGRPGGSLPIGWSFPPSWCTASQRLWAWRLDCRGTPPGHLSPLSAMHSSACTDAWGRIASDVVTLARPEIAELSEPAAGDRGGSSSMPQKRNPVLSILIRRAAICRAITGRDAAHRCRAGQRRTARRLVACRVGHATHPGPPDRGCRLPVR